MQDLPPLTDRELDLMKIVWGLGSATVRQVQERLESDLGERRAYTTVMTLLGILEQKGHLQKTAQDRAHRYTPVQSREEALSGMVQDFVRRVFDGASHPLLLTLVREGELSPEEVEELLREIEEAP